MMGELLNIPACPVIMFAERFHMGSDALFFVPCEEMAADDEPCVLESEECAIVQVPGMKFEAMKAVALTEHSEWAFLA